MKDKLTKWERRAVKVSCIPELLAATTAPSLFNFFCKTMRTVIE